MTATTQAAVAAQRAAMVEKIDRSRDREINLGDRVLLHLRLMLQDLPFDGIPQLLDDVHRSTLDALVDKHMNPKYRVRIKRITGYASRIGDEVDNLTLSAQRAEAAHQHLLGAITQAGIAPDDIFMPNFEVVAKGESDLPYPPAPNEDNPLNRRVEVAYNLFIDLPPHVDASQDPGPRSTLWQIDFGAAGEGWFLQLGAGTLTMLPDGGDQGPTDPVSKPFEFMQAGVSVGLFDKLKNAKFLQRFPRLRKMLDSLDVDGAGNYPKTSALLDELGFSVDFASVGGQFETSDPLSFHQMRQFNFAVASAGLSVLGKGEMALLLLHSGYFFAPTAIAGVGQNIALPDVGFTIAPLGYVVVDI
ncbi:MAG: OmpA family protein [Pseudomonadota bacterium]